MEKKYAILVISLLLLANLAQAQIEKGTHLVSVQAGNLIFSRKANIGSSIQLRPAYGFFVVNNLAVGLGVPFYYFNTRNPDFPGTVTNLGITPFVRYYIGSKTIKPFITASGGLLSSWGSDQSGSDRSPNRLLYAVGAGVAIFANKSISFDITANYTGVDTKDYYQLDSYPTNGLTLGFVNTVAVNLGFQVYFGRK